MWSALLAWLTTFAFKPVLEELAKEVGKDWVKDFFKGWSGRIFKRLLQIILPTARDKAIKGFKQLVKKELEADGLNKYQVKQYTRPLSQFLKKESVREILDSAFHKDCKTIDAIALARIWEESNLKDLPSNFNWDLVATPYYREVIKIRRDSAELRAILDSENLETIARHTRTTAQVLQAIAGTIPEFDLEQYRESLHKCYGYLELYVLDSTDQQYRLRLEDMFIPQMVRQGSPPSHYDLPKEIQQRLRETGQVEAEFSLEDLERYRESYLQKPARPVLEVLADDDYPHVVILGDPGSGKSTLLQYLALRWVKEPTERLPLLVKLGDYTCDPDKPLSFLNFFHLNRDDLNRQLQSGQAVVLFNGLDEVFDSVRQKEIITEIIGFTIEYKNARVIVTSRSVGYNLEQLRNAEFHYLTLQDLEPKQIHEFIGKWHELALGNHSNREMLQRRLEDAITNSKGNNSQPWASK